jgi:hypothetical protein
MTDTPDHIKALQLKIWLSKTPTQRIEQFMKENEIWFLEMKAIKERNEMALKEKSKEIPE